MISTPLSRAVERLAGALCSAPDEAMARDWTWGEYRGEGVRFAGFVAYGALRELAALIAVERALTQPPTVAQRLLGQYHAAFRDLHGLLLGVEADLVDHPPPGDAWSLRQTLDHLIEADAGFYAMVRVNLARHRAGVWSGEKIGAAEYERILGSEEAFRSIMAGPLEEMLAYHADMHETTLLDLEGITDAEAELPARFWESQIYPISFRLQRFDAHMRQHTIQVEQILDALGRRPTEGMRLARLLFQALAEVECAQIGAPDLAADRCLAVAGEIGGLASEVAPVLDR